jgi:3',5'-cyclic AMP phosphodiesterase CpdA
MKLDKQAQRLAGLAFFLFCCGLSTALAQDPCAAPCKFRFVVYGDTRGGKPKVKRDSKVPVKSKIKVKTQGDEIHSQMVAKAVSLKPALILQTGDLVYDGSVKEYWDKFDAITAEISKQHIPFYPSPGNHDVQDSQGNESKEARRSFEARVRDPVRDGGTKSFYAFDQDSIRFISIDTVSGLKNGNPQFQWLVSELKDAQDNHKFIIPYFHIAVYSIGYHGSKVALRKILHPLFMQYGVKLAFQGHDHNYYRTQRDNITYLVSGGGGAGLYAVGPDEKTKKREKLTAKQIEERFGKLKEDKFAQEYNYTVADVYPEEIRLTTYSLGPVGQPDTKLDQLRCPLNPAAPCRVVHD